ncbi:hypothetical protein BHM03_00026307 [Ensete ventricosum]|nr:hypothetical protein BHM03_00026307 [Ensete ventricosum]
MRCRAYVAPLLLRGVPPLVRFAYSLSAALTRSGRNGLLLFVYRLWRFFRPFFSRAEECQHSGSSRGQSNPLSLSSGVMTRADVKALQALEVMKSCHDFDPTEILAEEATRRALKVPIKRPAEDSTNHRKKTKVSGRQRSHHEGDKSRSRAAKGKRPIDLSEETPAPRAKPKSVKELCSTCLGEDDRDYHAIRMCNLPECTSNVLLEMDLTPRTHGMRIWLDGEASTRYI